MALEDKVLLEDFVVDEALAEAVRAQCKDGKLPCGKAHALAKAENIPPLHIGQTADVLNIHLSHCQMGLFGYPGHKKGWPPEGFEATEVLKTMIMSATKENLLTCTAAWAIAEELHISKMQVGYVADQMGIRLGQCQLGAF